MERLFNRILFIISVAMLFSITIRASIFADDSTDNSSIDAYFDERSGEVLVIDDVFTQEAFLEELSIGVGELFTDIVSDKWYSESVQFVYDNKIIIGTSKTTFSPNANITRDQIAVILFRMSGAPETSEKINMPDVEADKWYTKGVSWCVENNIIKGYKNGTFGIGNPITRQDLAVIMGRYAAFLKKDVDANEDCISNYNDADQISAYAIKAMNWAVANKILNGLKNGTKLNPKGNATRAECAAIIRRFCNTFNLLFKGSSVKLGSYEQDNIKDNGKEPIEWRVLDIEDERVLVISKYALERKPYYSEYAPITWECSTLRSWLNNDFLSDALSEEEQENIISMTVDNDDNPAYGTEGGNSTIDKVFLLSIDEVNKYFSNNASKKCLRTNYATGRYQTSNDDGSCWWWLRSPGYHSSAAAGVRASGTLSYTGFVVDSNFYSVRPAMWVKREVFE